MQLRLLSLLYASSVLFAADDYTVAENGSLTVAADDTQEYATLTATKQCTITNNGTLSMTKLTISNSTVSAGLSLINNEGAILTIEDMGTASNSTGCSITNYGTMYARRLVLQGGSLTNTGTLIMDGSLGEGTATSDAQLSSNTTSGGYIANTGTITLTNGAVYYTSGTITLGQSDSSVDASIVGYAGASLEEALMTTTGSVASFAYQTISNADITMSSGDNLTLDNVTLANTTVYGANANVTVTANNLTLQLSVSEMSDTLTITSLESVATTLTGSLSYEIILADASQLTDQITISLAGDSISSDQLEGLSLTFYTLSDEGLQEIATASSTDISDLSAVSFTVTSTIPEPTTTTLSLLALATLLRRRHRKI